MTDLIQRVRIRWCSYLLSTYFRCCDSSSRTDVDK